MVLTQVLCKPELCTFSGNAGEVFWLFGACISVLIEQILLLHLLILSLDFILAIQEARIQKEEVGGDLLGSAAACWAWPGAKSCRGLPLCGPHLPSQNLSCPTEQDSEATSKRVVGLCAVKVRPAHRCWPAILQSQPLRLGVLVKGVQGGPAVPPRRPSQVPSHQARVLVPDPGVVFCHSAPLVVCIYPQLPTLM